jgi:hypothetical protein
VDGFLMWPVGCRACVQPRNEDAASAGDPFASTVEEATERYSLPSLGEFHSTTLRHPVVL